MAQCMEAWLVADPEALAEFYDQGFNANALPKRINLEEEPKAQIYVALENATRQTQKARIFVSAPISIFATSPRATRSPDSVI